MIGQYRPAGRIQEGWQVAWEGQENSEPDEWVEVTKILRLLAPMRITRMYFANGEEAGVYSGQEVLCRTPAEIRQAERTAAAP